MKLVFLGTADIAVPSLRKLSSEHDVALVITQPDRPKGRGKKLSPSPVKVLANELGLEVYQPENINSEASISVIEKIKPDLTVVIAYGQILSKAFLEIPKKTAVNLHASLLPKYRGASPVQTAVLSGESIVGVTVMEIEETLDSGDILSVFEIPVGDKNAEELLEEMAERGAELLSDTLKKFDTFYAERKPQDEKKATYCKKLTKEDGKILWGNSAAKIKAMIKGLQPFPIAHSTLNGQKWKFYDAKVKDGKSDKPSGTIIAVGAEGICVATGEGILQITTLQLPNKRKMTVKEFLAGNTISVGECFE